jgi:hypothetical protein
LFLVFELAVVHQTTDRRRGRRGNFNQVHIQLTSHTKGISQRHDAQRLVVWSREANLWKTDFTVQAMFTLFALATITKFGSDGSNPLC